MRLMPAIRTLAGGAPGVLLLLVAWQAIHAVWGPFVLPAPLDSARALVRLAASGVLARAAFDTALAAVGGFLGGVAIGVALGLAAGAAPWAGRALQPAVTIILGVPPIAWVVLSLLWFGSGSLGPLMTTTLTTFPIVFAGTVQGARTLDPALADMARAFGAGPLVAFLDVRLPHLFAFLVPALATAHSIAWKATVMAEAMGGGTGLGGELALARVNLDLADAMALIVAAVVLLLALDALLLAPVQRRIERWRPAPSLAAER
jgi:NitT/TauT family transport system permease protein